MTQLPDHPDIAYALRNGCAPWEKDDPNCDEDMGPNLHPNIFELFGDREEVSDD